jgi:endonuclease/exonuclease/phosphatase family metal-dependent hydrolase
MAFIYDKSKITFKKMVGKVVLDFDNLLESEKGGLQFARTPFCMALQAGWFKFVLNTVHIYYGTTSVADREKRAKEIRALTKILDARADKEDVSYILLGDFNIPKTKPADMVMQALDGSHFFVPDAIKYHPSDLGGTNHYDQIAFRIKLKDQMTVFSAKEQKAGAFNFAKTVFRDNMEDAETYKQYFPANQKKKTGDELLSYYKTHWRTRQISDHLPLWVELKIDFSNQYLEKLLPK